MHIMCVNWDYHQLISSAFFIMLKKADFDSKNVEKILSFFYLTILMFGICLHFSRYVYKLLHIYMTYFDDIKAKGICTCMIFDVE